MVLPAVQQLAWERPVTSEGDRLVVSSAVLARIARVVVVSVVALALSAAITLLLIVLQAQSARGRLESAKVELTALVSSPAGAGQYQPSDKTIERIRGQFRGARSELASAQLALNYSPGLILAKVMPLAGQQISAADNILTVTLALTDATERGLSIVNIFDDQNARSALLRIGDGTIQLGPKFASTLDRVRSVEALLDAAAPAAQRLLTNPPIGPLNGVAVATGKMYEPIRSGFTQAVSGLLLLPSALGYDYPKTYLVALRNNAELRADGGAVLSTSTLAVDQGHVTVDLGATTVKGGRKQSVQDPPPWLKEQFESSGSLRVYQNVTYTANYAVAASVLAELFHQDSGKHIDGVLAIDPVALRAILQVVGPIRPDGADQEFNADNIVPFLLNGQYGLGDSRKEFLSQLWGATVTKLFTGGHDLKLVGRAMAQSASGNHLQLWMAEPTLERLVIDVKANGSFARYREHYLMPSIANYAANKLDYFLTRKIHHEMRLKSDGSASMTTTLTISNDLPEGQSGEVLGSPPKAHDTDKELPTGTYVGVATIYVPPNATLKKSQSQSWTSFESEAQAFHTPITIAPGETQSVVFKYQTPRISHQPPERDLEIVIQPQGTATPDQLQIDLIPPPHATIDNKTGTQTITMPLNQT